jgi:hypothetical protein
VLAFDLEFAQGDGLFHKERISNYRTGDGGINRKSLPLELMFRSQ